MLALKLLCNSLCGPLPKSLESLGLYESDRQSETPRRGCHFWELQDEPLLFADELVQHAWIFSTGSSARIWSIFCCVRPRRNENQLWKDWGIVSLKTPNVYSASEGKCSGAGGDVQVAWGDIHEWGNSEQTDWYTEW